VRPSRFCGKNKLPPINWVQGKRFQKGDEKEKTENKGVGVKVKKRGRRSSKSGGSCERERREG